MEALLIPIGGNGTESSESEVLLEAEALTLFEFLCGPKATKQKQKIIVIARGAPISQGWELATVRELSTIY